MGKKKKKEKNPGVLHEDEQEAIMDAFLGTLKPASSAPAAIFDIFEHADDPAPGCAPPTVAVYDMSATDGTMDDSTLDVTKQFQDDVHTPAPRTAVPCREPWCDIDPAEDNDVCDSGINVEVTTVPVMLPSTGHAGAADLETQRGPLQSKDTLDEGELCTLDASDSLGKDDSLGPQSDIHASHNLPDGTDTPTDNGDADAVGDCPYEDSLRNLPLGASFYQQAHMILPDVFPQSPDGDPLAWPAHIAQPNFLNNDDFLAKFGKEAHGSPSDMDASVGGAQSALKDSNSHSKDCNSQAHGCPRNSDATDGGEKSGLKDFNSHWKDHNSRAHTCLRDSNATDGGEKSSLKDSNSHLKDHNSHAHGCPRDSDAIDGGEKSGLKDSNSHLKDYNSRAHACLRGSDATDGGEKSGLKDYNSHLKDHNSHAHGCLRDSKAIDGGEKSGLKDFISQEDDNSQAHSCLHDSDATDGGEKSCLKNHNSHANDYLRDSVAIDGGEKSSLKDYNSHEQGFAVEGLHATHGVGHASSRGECHSGQAAPSGSQAVEGLHATHGVGHASPRGECHSGQAAPSGSHGVTSRQSLAQISQLCGTFDPGALSDMLEAFVSRQRALYDERDAADLAQKEHIRQLLSKLR